MQLVIDIPDKQYELIKQSDYNVFGMLASKECMMYAIKNGTPLPKGHGDLIDRDVLLSDLSKLCYDESSLADNPYIENPHIDSIVDVVENSSTIVLSDKEETNETDTRTDDDL